MVASIIAAIIGILAAIVGVWWGYDQRRARQAHERLERYLLDGERADDAERAHIYEEHHEIASIRDPIARARAAVDRAAEARRRAGYVTSGTGAPVDLPRGATGSTVGTGSTGSTGGTGGTGGSGGGTL